MWSVLRDSRRLAGCSLMLLTMGCASPRLPAVESPRLTTTDIAVLRETSQVAIQPLIGSSRNPVAVSVMTLAIPLDEAPALRSFSLPPSPPPFRTIVAIVPTPTVTPVSGELLGPEERRAWRLRNGVMREMPDLAVAGWSIAPPVAHGGQRTMVAFSAPSYPEPNSALLYARFICGETCGEGRLIRLSRGTEGWRLTASIRLWIS
jgi:hypothetical protein